MPASLRWARRLAAALPFALLACCVAPEKAPPPPPPAPPPPPPPPPTLGDWRDAPLTPGVWAYIPDAGGSRAVFGADATEARFILRCDLAMRTVTLSWPGVAPPEGAPVTITTSFGDTGFNATATPAHPGRVGLVMSASSPFLDGIAFSRGRFAIRTGVMARTVIPAWPEPARAIEDCRK